MNIVRLLPILLSASASACSPNEQTGVDGIDGFATREHDGGAGDGAVGDGDLDPEPLAFGVVSSDRSVASITLLRPDGTILAKDFINSGSAQAGLVAALSGDVVLPTRSGDPETLTLIDRFRTDVITRVDPASGEILGQVKTHAPNDASDETGYTSNPYDYVHLGDRDAWVTRFAPNVSVGADDPDQGNDLLHIDPTGFERGARISLWHLDGEAERMNPDTMEVQTVPVHARPAYMVRLGNLLVVGLANLSLTYDAAGPGMVALVDPEAKTAEGFELTGLQNCIDVVPVPHDSTRVVVACSGFFRGVPRDSAGLAMLKLEAGELSIEHVWRGGDHQDAPLTVASVVSLGGTDVVAMAAGERAVTDDDGKEVEPATHDAMYVVNIATGEQTLLFEAQGRYKIGSGAFNARRNLLLVPDASTDEDARPSAGVRLFERGDDGRFEAGDVIALDPILPPTQVRAL